MKFVLQRDRVYASKMGHAIGFEKGVPTHVPPALYEEVMAIGAVPEEEIAVDDTRAAEFTAEERKLLIQTAIEEIVLKNDAADFTAGGLPHAKVVAAKAGVNVDAGERDAAWATFLANKK